MTSKKSIMPLISTIFIVYAVGGLLSHPVTASEYGYRESAPSKSKRIEVYALSQNHWDTRFGDTLSDIVSQLLPNNPSKLAALERDIVNLNPHAFINGDPERLLADKRLWLPVYMKQQDTRVNPDTTAVESYSWGNIKRQR